MKTKKEYIFKGFGFDVLLHDVEIAEKNGESYPILNMNYVKYRTAKSLLLSASKLTGAQLKFLRTYIGLSHDSLSDAIIVPASTLRSWESKNDSPTGLAEDQEKALRVFVNNKINDALRTAFDRNIILNPLDGKESAAKPIDTALSEEFELLKIAL